MSVSTKSRDYCVLVWIKVVLSNLKIRLNIIYQVAQKIHFIYDPIIERTPSAIFFNFFVNLVLFRHLCVFIIT